MHRKWPALQFTAVLDVLLRSTAGERDRGGIEAVVADFVCQCAEHVPLRILRRIRGFQALPLLGRYNDCRRLRG